jgi:ABC-type proline/glycine betaine transport system permease subunit|tara:strand:- start:3327 stop:3662 length:336 start_codon:yes stop_codon:yes gene_type:complete
MENILILAQLIVSISVLIVWVFRYDNIVLEFKQYGLSNLLRNFVGALKISLATILILGIWHQEFLFIASMAMAFLMVCAQLCHFKVKNNWMKFMPSLSLLILSLLIAYSNY